MPRFADKSKSKIDTYGSDKNQKKKSCYFTENKIKYIDFKDDKLLKKYVNERGKIIPRRISGVQARYQRQLATAIKRARYMALLPYVSNNLK